MRFLAMPTDRVRELQGGAPDVHGRVPERTRSDGDGNSCRHFLQDIPDGASMLVLAYRPFGALQPYVESGPIFLCAEPCRRHPETRELPTMFAARPAFLARGYDTDERIVYGTGGVRSTAELVAALDAMFENPRVAFAHLRSASYNCFQCRVEPERIDR